MGGERVKGVVKKAPRESELTSLCPPEFVFLGAGPSVAERRVGRAEKGLDSLDPRVITPTALRWIEHGSHKFKSNTPGCVQPWQGGILEEKTAAHRSFSSFPPAEVDFRAGY